MVSAKKAKGKCETPDIRSKGSIKVDQPLPADICSLVSSRYGVIVDLEGTLVMAT